ncbi:MAG: PfkB family carbohydrate kinase, partial [Thermoleophilia bacterium]|nr:PfkB family carbohydrate kinase [Thermoleophilia bacterium]
MAKVAVVGSVAVDRIDGQPPSAGGCPSFGALAMRMLGHEGQIVTRYAEADAALFEPVLSTLGVPVTCLPAGTTTAFGIRYDGERREMTVEALGELWSPADASALDPQVTWVHVAPLLRSDFPPETVAALGAGERIVSYDGQGLVRVPELGPLRLDAAFDPALLASISVLKLAEEEAAVVAGGRFGEEHARGLGVPEVLVTEGSRGCTLYLDGEGRHVPAAWPVLGVQTTGAGDVFMVGYAVARANGEDPVRACELASELVARTLEERRRAASGTGA